MSLDNLYTKGYTVINGIFTPEEIESISEKMNRTDSSKPTFKKTNELFSIRQFLKEIPEVRTLVFNSRLNSIIGQYFGEDYFSVKSIYFDKPEHSN